MTKANAPTGMQILRPDPGSLEVAHAIKNRMGKRTFAPVRATFVGSHASSEDRGPEGGVPPMAKILRGGRGGEVRLKLELSFLWFAANPPHDLTFPARVWATLIGLADPEGRGTRRVRQANTALAAENLIKVEGQAGRPNKIFLLEESGTYKPYVLPGEAYNKSKGSGQEWRHRYIQIPDTLWTNGWISILSGAALAMLLVLFAELGQKDASKTDLWFSPDWAKKIYGLSEDTRSKGLRELRTAEIITARKRSASRDVLDFRRLRNTYRLDLERFNDPAELRLGEAPPAPLHPNEVSLEGFHTLLQSTSKKVD
ncbi:hypothetical protein NtRootA2_41400 (plasmid) [Arthrobacter sp. NtRootA2]|nr:hypothetical protein NtRootA2_41400 [Arthrobacter sp. NtRootA2]